MQTTAYRASWPSGVCVIWRSLTWKEYRALSSLPVGDQARYIAVYRQVLIAGPPAEKVPAGIAVWIGRYELENNPFSGNLKPIQVQRKKSAAWGQSYLNASRAIVAWAFGYKFEELDEWDANTFFNRLAQAEYIFGKPFDPQDPNAPVEEPKKKGRMPDPRVERIKQLKQGRK